MLIENEDAMNPDPPQIGPELEEAEMNAWLTRLAEESLADSRPGILPLRFFVSGAISIASGVFNSMLLHQVARDIPGERH
jgi:hypothetical protein